MSTMKWYWMKYTLKRYHEYLELTNSNDNLCGVTRGGYDQHGNIDVAKEAPKWQTMDDGDLDTQT